MDDFDRLSNGGGVEGKLYQGDDVWVAAGLEKDPHALLVPPLGGQV